MKLLVFLHDDRPSRLRSAAALVAATAATGRPVVVVWEAAALRRLCRGELDELEKSARDAGLPTPGEMLGEARTLGGVRYLACSTEIIAAGLDEAAVREAVDEVVGLASILAEAEGATTLFI